MPALVNVAIHPSQFPAKVRADLLASLGRRQINHKFHYDSYKQTQKWLELHQAVSPARTDPNCEACYDLAFAAAVNRIGTASTHLIGLGCGGGQKDTRLLQLLKNKSHHLIYTPVDVSTAMVLVAHQAASEVAAAFPLVCDLAEAEDLATILPAQTPPGASRVITFFGMIPNFEPDIILPKLAKLVGPEDHLLLSANLAPGPDYAAGMRRVMPQYENTLTNDWLLTFLLDLGVERTDGALAWRIEDGPSGNDLQRLTACYRFDRARTLRVGNDEFAFAAGDIIRLFFSYRYTAKRLRNQLARQGLIVQEEWIMVSGEEGVFLCKSQHP